MKAGLTTRLCEACCFVLRALLLAPQCVQFEPQIFEETHELRSLLLDSLQRVEANGVGRDEFIEFHDGIGGFRARRKKLGNLRLTQMSGQMHHYTAVLASQLYPAPHNSPQFSNRRTARFTADS